METKDLQYFLAVYREKSINKAAKQLFITAQGLGRILSRLEDELGAVLFTRTQKGVAPTEAADYLYLRAELLLKQVTDTQNGLRQLMRKEKTLRVACAAGVLNALSVELLPGFIRMNPEMTVEWSEHSNAEACRQVVTSQADIGLVVGRPDSDALLERKIAGREVVLLVYRGHPFYERERVSIDDLRDERIVTLNSQYRVNREFRERCRRQGFSPNIAAESADSHLLYKLCLHRVGLGVLIDFSTDHFRMPDMRVIPFAEPFPWEIYEIVTERSASFPIVRMFQDYLQTFLRER